MWKTSFRSLVKLLAIASFAIALLYLWSLTANRISPATRTENTMLVIKERANIFAAAHGHLPQQLGDLPELPGKDNSTVDAWGAPLLLAIDSTGIVTISSLGADKRQGGENENADIVRKFRVCVEKDCGSSSLAPWLD